MHVQKLLDLKHRYQGSRLLTFSSIYLCYLTVGVPSYQLVYDLFCIMKADVLKKVISIINYFHRINLRVFFISFAKI